MIVIIDYGMGNLRSVEKALHFIGYDALISSDLNIIQNAPKIILPGVGAFGDAVKKLNQLGLMQLIRDKINQNTPFLGICLGMQLLFTHSEEGPGYEGLGLVPGKITKIPNRGLKIPHMGWNTLNTKQSILFDGESRPYAYFVHSYHMPIISPLWTSATTTYGNEFTVAIETKNILGTQFHPEKSGDEGLLMLKKFAQWQYNK